MIHSPSSCLKLVNFFLSFLEEYILARFLYYESEWGPGLSRLKWQKHMIKVVQ